MPEKAKEDTMAVNEYNASLLKAVLDDGRIFISSTSIDGIFRLRIANLSLRIHLEHIRLLLDILKAETEEDRRRSKTAV